MYTPRGIAYRNGSIYVTDIILNAIIVYSKSGVWQNSYVVQGLTSGMHNVIVDSNGTIYVADDSNGRVVAITPTAAPDIYINFATGWANYSTTLNYTSGQADGYWLVTPPAAGSTLQSAAVLEPGDTNYWSGWPSNAPLSQWIGVSATATAPGFGGPYNFTTQFTLPWNAILSSLTLTGQYSCDDRCTIYLNGQDQTPYLKGAGELSYTQISINSTNGRFIVGGTNIVTFTLLDVIGENGINLAARVSGSMNASAIPLAMSSSTAAPPLNIILSSSLSSSSSTTHVQSVSSSSFMAFSSTAQSSAIAPSSSASKQATSSMTPQAGSSLPYSSSTTRSESGSPVANDAQPSPALLATDIAIITALAGMLLMNMY